MLELAPIWSIDAQLDLSNTTAGTAGAKKNSVKARLLHKAVIYPTNLVEYLLQNKIILPGRMPVMVFVSLLS
jgi:hypothetical protein